MKKQKDFLHCIAIVFIFFATLSTMALYSKKKEVVKRQNSYYPFDLFAPDIIITISFGR